MLKEADRRLSHNRGRGAALRLRRGDHRRRSQPPAAARGAGGGEGRLGAARASSPSRTSRSSLEAAGGLHPADGRVRRRSLHQADGRATPTCWSCAASPTRRPPTSAAGWHSDWSFQATPPAATILRSEVVPPVGGDTLFADCARAYEALSPTMQQMLAPLRAVHSAARRLRHPGRLRQGDREADHADHLVEGGREDPHPPAGPHPSGHRPQGAVRLARSTPWAIEGMTRAETDAHPGLALQAHGPGPVHLPPPLGGRDGAHVGQPLHHAPGRRRLRRPPAR